MSLTRIARGALAVTLAMGTSLVLVVQQAPPALAFQAPMPPPVTVPGTAYPQTSISGMGANEYNRALSKNPMGYVTAPSSTLLKKAGTAMAVVGGVDMVYGLTVGPITSLTGVSTSGSLFCDLAVAVVSSNCDLAPAPDYVPNSDIELTAGGWVGSNSGPVAYNPPGQENAPDATYSMFGEGTFGGSIVMRVQATLPGTYGTNFALGAVYGTEYTTYMHPDGHTEGMRQGGFTGTLWGGISRPGPVEYAKGYEAVGQYGSWVLDHIAILDGYGGPEVAWWYPEGHVQRPPEPSSDPVRHWESRWECSDGSTGTKSSETFHESDAIYPMMPPATCEVGHAVMYEVLQVTEGLLEKIRVYFWEKAPGSETTWDAVPEKCLDFVSCALELWMKDPLTGELIDCFKNPKVCEGFDPTPSPAPGAPSIDDFQCKWGGQILAVINCAVYKPTLAKPESTSDPAPPARPYGDPVTGDAPTDVPKPNPNPPGSGSGSPDDPSDGCPPPFKWNSLFNPWWYYKSATCSLAWAFVPAGGFAIGASLIAAWDDTAFGDLSDSFGKLSDVVMDGTCGQLFAVEPTVFNGHLFTVDTCSPFWAGAAPIRTLIGISFVLSATYGGVALALGSLGFYLNFGGKDR